MRTLVIFALSASATAALGHEIELCGQLLGETGSGVTLFRESPGEDIRFEIEVQGLEPDALLPVRYNGEVVAELQTDEQGRGRIRFRGEPGGDELPLPPAVEALRSGDVVEVGGVSGPVGQVGDLRPDCEIDAFDIEPFLLALVDPQALIEAFPRIDPAYSADINRDGAVDAFDIEPFIELLLEG